MTFVASARRPGPLCTRQRAYVTCTSSVSHNLYCQIVLRSLNKQILNLNNNAKPDYTALQLQTSFWMIQIPMVWGKAKIAPNLMWYANFKAVQGGRKRRRRQGWRPIGRRAAGEKYTYTADLILALCEGPITQWLCLESLGVYGLEQLGLGSFNGSTPQIVSALSGNIVPYNALAYQGTAYVWGAGYNLGTAAAIGNHNFEVFWALFWIIG